MGRASIGRISTRRVSTNSHFLVTRAIRGVLLLALLCPVSANAQIPLGGEFQVNTYTTLQQRFSRVAAGPNGNFVVVWQSAGSFGGDDDGSSAQARLYDSVGNSLVAEFQVNTYTTSIQGSPSTDFVGPDGDFVVVWSSLGSDGDDASDTSIQAQVFDSQGDPMGGEFQVNTHTTGPQRYPAVAGAANGDFVVVWSGSTENDSDGLAGQRFQTAGPVPVGSEFQVNSYLTGLQALPGVAMSAAGDFVVVWGGSFPNDLIAVLGRRFASDGSPLGDDFALATYTGGNQNWPSVDIDAAGNFVVAFSSQCFEPQCGDDDRESIRARRFDSNGIGQGSEFLVNSYTTDRQERPRIAFVNTSAPGAEEVSGGFVIVWESGYYGVGEPDGSYSAIRGQAFTNSGSTVGGEFQVNSYTTNRQQYPDIAAQPDGRFAVVWHSIGSSDTDDSIHSSQGQRFLASYIFAGTFESGDSSGWTVFP